MTVCEMAAMRKIHAENRVSGLQYSQVHRHIGLAPGVRLHVDMIGSKKLLCAINRQVFYDIHELSASVIPAAGISFRLTVCEDGPGCIQNGTVGEVFRR